MPSHPLSRAAPTTWRKLGRNLCEVPGQGDSEELDASHRKPWVQREEIAQRLHVLPASCPQVGCVRTRTAGVKAAADVISASVLGLVAESLTDLKSPNRFYQKATALFGTRNLASRQIFLPG